MACKAPEGEEALNLLLTLRAVAETLMEATEAPVLVSMVISLEIDTSEIKSLSYIYQPCKLGYIS